MALVERLRLPAVYWSCPFLGDANGMTAGTWLALTSDDYQRAKVGRSLATDCLVGSAGEACDSGIAS
jgi:hypothetical protein